MAGDRARAQVGVPQVLLDIELDLRIPAIDHGGAGTERFEGDGVTRRDQVEEMPGNAALMVRGESRLEARTEAENQGGDAAGQRLIAGQGTSAEIFGRGEVLAKYVRRHAQHDDLGVLFHRVGVGRRTVVESEVSGAHHGLVAEMG